LYWNKFFINLKEGDAVSRNEVAEFALTRTNKFATIYQAFCKE